MPGRRRALLAAVVAAGVAVTAAHALGEGRGPSKAAPKRFSITGHADGLMPGRRSPLPVKIRNPWSWPIRVTYVSAYIEASGRPCPVRNVQVQRFKGSFLVRRRSTRVLALNAGLRANAPTTCEGATFALTFSGTAVRR
jgi:hypothetical protein